jgi:hypothetical protein
MFDVGRSMLVRLGRVRGSLVSHLIRLDAGGQRRRSYETTWNDECRLTNGGIASGFAFGYDPTGRSVVLKMTEFINSTFDVHQFPF